MILETNKAWYREYLRFAFCLVPVFAMGCTFDAVGSDLPGLGCDLDFRLTEMLLDPSPYVDGLVGADGDEPEEEEFIVFNEDFGVNWSFHYQSFYPGQGQHPYITSIRILKNDEVVWEMEIDSDPIKRKEKGDDSVIVQGGLPRGHYTLVVELDVDGEVPECDGFGAALLNNSMEMDFDVWGSFGPPQNPTPCQEAGLPDCED